MSDQNNVSSPEMLDFLKSPVKDMPALSSVKEKLSIFIPLFLLEIVIAIFCGGIISQLTNGLHLMEGNKLEHFFSYYPVWVVFIYVALAGPMLEELMFRLPLRLNEKYVQLNVVLMLTGLMFILVSSIKIFIIQVSLITIEIILLSVYFAGKELFNKYILSIWDRKYIWVFYLSAVIFGLLHISNYNPKFLTFLLMPILVLPQFIVGLFCGYIRIRLGFFWGYFFHAIHNFVFIIPLLLTPLIINPVNKSVEITEHDNHNKYTIKVPRVGFDKLNKYFEDQYGFRFNRIMTKVTGYRITSGIDK